MNTNPQIYHGEWWVPAVADHDTRMVYPEPEQMMWNERPYTGTLTYYEDEDSTLELYHVPSNFHARHYQYNKVIWGKDANLMRYTLFNVVMQEKPLGDFTKTTFDVGLILIGDHVLSLDEVNFCECVVQFPFLRNWAFHDNLTYYKEMNKHYHILSADNPGRTQIEVRMKDDTKWGLRDKCTQIRTDYDLTIKQVTEFLIKSQGFSLHNCIQQIKEFAQFLSIALYCDQSPQLVLLINKDKTRRSQLLFKSQKSVEPQKNILIKYNELKEKVPSMLKIWHENFNNIAPISSYLIDSLREKNRFDVPDFLIIAQALDGYHKRFINKKNGKDNKKYEDQIKILLNQFRDVEVIKKIKMKPEVLTASRHKYSHLLPDDELPLAVEGEDLYWLTEKCKILLTCCILNMLGLTNEEINLCCEQSPISQIIDSLPLEID